MNPKISLVVPVYNVEKYIAECLESLINQSFKDIEIICVDDCGSDRSVEIIESYAKRDPRIKIIRNKKNLSLFQARMQGVLAQSTDWTLFCDSDDFLEPSACEEFYNATQGDFDIISAGCYRYGGGGENLWLHTHA